MKAAPREAGSEGSFAERLQGDLLEGKYRPGEWLKQIDLESAYRVNRFEVRIVLSELAARHLLDHSPNRGYRVANPNHREREEVLEVLTFLETGASQTAVMRATAADVDRFEELVREFDHEVRLGNLPKLPQINGRLHDALYASCGNELLAPRSASCAPAALPVPPELGTHWPASRRGTRIISPCSRR